MEYEQDDKENEGGILARLRESPRTVSALIVILIIAAAIYAFSGEQSRQQEQQSPLSTRQAESTQEVLTDTSTTGQPQQDQQPASVPTGTGYVETAESGDGITHLSRRATQRYLSENAVGWEVTKEHRIYVEDYIKDRIGSKKLALGESMTIPFEVITEALEVARTLTPSQLENLSQYTHVLT